MAEFRKLPTQEELQRMLFMQGIQPRSTQDIVQQNLQSQTIKPIPQNVFQKIAGGAETAGKFVNQAGTAADVARLFPGYTGQSQVNIPTGYNFGIKQDPMGGVIPQGLQTQQVNVDQLLKAIKPADVLGLTGAQQAYSDVGMGRAPNPMDVLDVAGLGAAGMGAGKGLLKAAEATKNLPVGMSIQDVSGGLLKPEAQVSPIGFYSAVEQAALNTPRKSGAGQAFLNDIMKGENVKADEIKWMGLDDYLKGKQNVTRQEVQDYIANNRVNVEEVKSTIPRLPGEEMPGDKGAFLPKFGQYQLPGGENYRELLLTMPAKNSKEINAINQQIKTQEQVIKQAGVYAYENPDQLQNMRVKRDIAEQKIINLKNQLNQFGGNIDEYTTSHFPDIKNTLAHLRVNDRVDADGKKMLLIEEVQSDWHQAGRDKGYGITTKFQVEDVNGQVVGSFDNENEAKKLASTIRYGKVNKLKSDGVPDAPFKDNWYQLALKRAIQHAAENGYDRIGLTTGSRQAERFDLSKQVNEIVVPTVMPDGGRSVRIDPTGGTSIKLMVDKDGTVTGYGSGSTQFSGKKLNEVIGKEMADKVMKAEADSRFAGLDLKVGGEGMKKYYDEIYPKFLDKYGKKWGARVGETNINVKGGMPNESSDYYIDNSTGSNMEKVRYIDITSEMKAGVSKGQPLFTAAPIAGGGLLGAQQEER